MDEENPRKSTRMIEVNCCKNFIYLNITRQSGWKMDLEKWNVDDARANFNKTRNAACTTDERPHFTNKKSTAHNFRCHGKLNTDFSAPSEE